MAKQYKVWIEIEEFDEDMDSYDDEIILPICVGECDSQDDAIECVKDIMRYRGISEDVY